MKYRWRPRDLHTVKDGTHVFDFANASNDRVDSWVRLRGKHTSQQWNPHSGTMSLLERELITENDQQVTCMHLVLEPVKSVFRTGPFEAAAGGVKGKK